MFALVFCLVAKDTSIIDVKKLRKANGNRTNASDESENFTIGDQIKFMKFRQWCDGKIIQLSGK